MHVAVSEPRLVLFPPNLFLPAGAPPLSPFLPSSASVSSSFPVILPLQSVSRLTPPFRFQQLSHLQPYLQLPCSDTNQREGNWGGQAFPWLAAMFWLVTIQQAQSHRRNMEEKIGIDSGFLCLKSADCWLHFNTLSLRKLMQRTHDTLWVTSKYL